MSGTTQPEPAAARPTAPALPLVAGAVVFLVLFRGPLAGTVRLWWTDAESAHGLLLAPVAVWLAWRSGLTAAPRPQPFFGAALLAVAVALRYAGGLAAEPYTMRLAILVAGCGLVVSVFGLRQIRHWWLPATLLFLSLPLPELLVAGLALPLQLEASRLGATLLAWRHVPVTLAGNVIELPGRSLFVTEACSGLRSLTALLAIGVLIGGLWLRTAWARVMLVAAAVPVAMLLNAVRIFATGFAVHFISPDLGEGVLHLTEGWVTFAIALAVLAGLARLLLEAENLRGVRGRARV